MGYETQPGSGKVTRRRANGVCGSLIMGSPVLLAAPFPNDMQVTEVRTSYEDFLYRTPIKFGGNVVDRVTLLNVNCTVRGRTGKTAHGFGSTPLGNVWSFPSHKLAYAQTLQAMKDLAGRIAKLTEAHGEWGHPIDLTLALEPSYSQAAADISRGLAEPIPPLCTVVTASPFDAALHDAYGKLHGRNSFSTLRPEFLRNDPGYYLGPEFRDERLDHYIPAKPKPVLPLHHLVGAVDPILPDDIQHTVGDGLSEDLPGWIRRDGITHIKIKLNGDDRAWDMNRVVRVHKAALSAGRADFVYSLDFNEKRPNVAYPLDFLHDLKAGSPEVFARIQYVEQPTARDLKAHPNDDVHEAARLVPVVIDESLTGIDAFLLALKMGYSGAALKACKGKSTELLIAALAQKKKVFLCVQDLTCPGASLVHSVTLTAHVPGVAAIESNARQYVPAANAGWEKRFPGIFIVRDGQLRTDGTGGPGLGVIPS
ncbi:MAG: mandelate racemase/muconate lactonizing enzyme family protein [Bryobacteraceae bacterium]